MAFNFCFSNRRKCNKSNETHKRANVIVINNNFSNPTSITIFIFIFFLACRLHSNHPLCKKHNIWTETDCFNVTSYTYLFDWLSGLTVDDQVVSSTAPEDDSQAVISLCHVERRRDGHWLIPDPYLPCLLNDEDVTEATLLSQGTVLL